MYYLLVIKYEKSDEYIRQNVEPYLHAFSILTATASSTILYFSNIYNDYGSVTCISPEYYPPHCIGYNSGEIRYEDGFTIPCSPRGGGYRLFIFVFYFSLLTILPPVIIGTCFILIECKVMKSEKRMSIYGVGSLNLDLKPQPPSAQIHDHDQEQETIGARSRTTTFFIKSMETLAFKIKSKKSQTTRSSFHSARTRKSRAVMYKALAYTISYSLTFSFFAMYVGVEGVARKECPLVLEYMAALFIPLQGLYNLTIYIYPRVIEIKNKAKRKKFTWRQAIIKAIFSKGRKAKMKRSIKTSPTKTTHNERKEKFEYRKTKLYNV